MSKNLIERPSIGDIIYFTGYGIVEELKLYKITTEETEEEFTSYFYAVRRDGTTECVDYKELGKTAFLDPLSADEALSGKVSNIISSLQNTVSVCTLERKTLTNNRLCPHCGGSYYAENNMTSTCVYYQPIWKDGVNINPDRNKTTVHCTCLECGKEFSYTL